MKAIFPALVIVLLATILTGRVGGRGGEAGAEGGGDAERPAAERARWVIDSSCAVLADVPARDRRNSRILGPAHYRCDRPGADLDFTVYLQKRTDNGGWTTIDSRPVVARGADTTRDRSERQRTVTTIGACIDGVYRTFLRGTATIRGRTRTVEDDSATVTNPCRNTRAQ